MKTRSLLALALIGLAAACGTDGPTEARTPAAPSLDGGSLGPGHRTGDGATTATTSDTTAVTALGGSLGPGH